MLEKLKRRWKVNGWNLILILVTFATGGSLCGYAARKILLFIGLEKNFTWVILYIILLTLLWPLSVILISIPLGQFSFFRKYLVKVVRRFGYKSPNGTTRIAIFASGTGSNAKNIIDYFSKRAGIEVAFIVSNKENAGVLQIAKDNDIDHIVISRGELENPGLFLNKLKERKIDFIILAGFLLRLPAILIDAFPKRIINIHPALLPAYGGQGMYGTYVHEAVIANKEQQSGITIHYADNIYDHGEIIFQSACMIDPSETVETLAHKVQLLEHKHYPSVIEKIIKTR